MSTNLSRKKRLENTEHLDQLSHVISKSTLKDSEKNLLHTRLNHLKSELNAKKYGIVYERHHETIDEQLKNSIPVLHEVEDLCIDKNKRMNTIIEGDNLSSLMILEKTHKSRIDMIYIDPPYNTKKSGFTYSDTLIDSNDRFRHSKWLSFMSRRLKIAKKLLSECGSIFISIDDNEVGALRLLCDEIFGPTNFVSNVIWEKKFSPQNDTKWISDNHDHILVYARNKKSWTSNLLDRTEESNNRYKNPDDDPRGPWTASDFSVKTASDAYIYPIVTPSGREVLPASSRSWSTSRENFEKLVADNRIWFGKTGNNVPRVKTFLSEVQDGIVSKSIWFRSEVGDTQEGTKDLKEVFGGKGVFTNPKPLRLIEKCLKIASHKDSIVLDFFAGSGTTGHAVLRQNQKDGGNRTFILCTNNENNICKDVTYERIKRVISGYHFTGKKEQLLYNQKMTMNVFKNSSKYISEIEKIKQLNAQNFDELKTVVKDDAIKLIGINRHDSQIPSINESIKYYKIKYVPTKNLLYYEYSDNLLNHVIEMIELENGVNLRNNSSIEVILDDDDLDSFISSLSENNSITTLYLGNNVLIDGYHEESLRNNSIRLEVIPDYYYKKFWG